MLAVPSRRPGGRQIGADAGELICVASQQDSPPSGQFYAGFPQLAGDEVIACLERAAMPGAPARPGTVRAASSADPPARGEEDVSPRPVPSSWPAYLTMPQNAPGIVVFVHGSGSSRHSPRNQYVASVLNEAGLGTLLFDLLTPEEEPTGPTCSTSACSPAAWPR